MLVLTRKPGESIVIRYPVVLDDNYGDLTWGTEEIVVKVLGIDRGAVKWGIDAPKDVEIDRLEVRESKDANPR